MHILKHLKWPWDWNIALHIWLINKWWCCEMFLGHSRGKGVQWTVGVKDWIGQIDSPSGLGAQPPVTPLQLQQEIIQFHPFASRRSLGWWSIIWESRENRSYLELHLPRHLFLSVTCQTPEALSHLAETLAITHHRRINSTEQSSPSSKHSVALFLLNPLFKQEVSLRSRQRHSHYEMV